MCTKSRYPALAAPERLAKPENLADARVYTCTHIHAHYKMSVTHELVIPEKSAKDEVLLTEQTTESVHYKTNQDLSVTDTVSSPPVYIQVHAKINAVIEDGTKQTPHLKPSTHEQGTATVDPPWNG